MKSCAARALSEIRELAALLKVAGLPLAVSPELVECALTIGDIESYGLPADFTKRSDSRSAAFVAKWGDVSVELDALPIEALRERIVAEVERRIDLTALEMVRADEDEERRRLVQALGAIGGRT